MDSCPTPARRPRRSRRVGAGATCVLALFGLAGCASTPGLATGSAEELAAGADRLAAHLEAEAACDAREQADALLVRAREGETAGEVPPDVVDRIEHVAERVHREVPCDPEAEATGTTDDPAASDPAPAQARDDDGGGEPGEDGGKAKAKGKGKGKGNNGKGKG